MKLDGILKKKNGKFIAIDFGEGVIKIAHMEAGTPNFKLLKYELSRIVPGEEKKEETAVDFINNFLKKKSIPDKDVYLSISDSDAIIIKYLALPILPEDEILEAAKWQLKDEIPFDLQYAVFDWQVVREYMDEEGAKKNGIIFIVAKKEVVDSYVSITYKCGLNPLGITSEHFNYGELLSFYPESSPVLSILDIGYDDATLCIYIDNKLNFVRKLAFSSRKLTESLTGVLVSDKGKIELSWQEAENIKVSCGIPLDLTQIIQNNIQANQIVYLMRHLLEGLVRELKFSFEYFAANFNPQRPDRLYITGGGAGLKNLEKYLSRELAVNVEQLPFPVTIETPGISKENLDRDKNQILNCLGVGIGYGRGINILPPEIKAKKQEFLLKAVLRLVSFVFATGLLILFFTAKFQEYTYKKKLNDAQSYLGSIEEIRNLKQKINLRDSLLNKIQKNNVPVDGILKYISVVIPQEIILDELFFDRGEHKLVLKGSVSASENNAETILIDFIRKLEKTLFFSETGLVSSRRSGEIQEFEINCTLATG